MYSFIFSFYVNSVLSFFRSKLDTPFLVCLNLRLTYLFMFIQGCCLSFYSCDGFALVTNATLIDKQFLFSIIHLKSLVSLFQFFRFEREFRSFHGFIFLFSYCCRYTTQYFFSFILKCMPVTE